MEGNEKEGRFLLVSDVIHSYAGMCWVLLRKFSWWTHLRKEVSFVPPSMTFCISTFFTDHQRSAKGLSFWQSALELDYRLVDTELKLWVPVSVGLEDKVCFVYSENLQSFAPTSKSTWKPSRSISADLNWLVSLRASSVLPDNWALTDMCFANKTPSGMELYYQNCSFINLSPFTHTWFSFVAANLQPRWGP